MTGQDKLKIMRESDYDPNQVELIMKHRIELRRYKKEFNKKYPTTNEQKNFQEEINDIQTQIKEHQAFIKNQPIGEILKECRTYFSRTYLPEEYWESYLQDKNINKNRECNDKKMSKN